MTKTTLRSMILVLYLLIGCLESILLPSTVFVESTHFDMAASSTWSDWFHYHNYTEIVNTILYLNETYPELVDVFPIGQSWLNKTIYCVRLTNESIAHPKPEVFFDGYHHAREPITSELTLYFLVDTITKFGTNTTITQILNYSQIYVVVALNVDGFDSVGKNEWHRKNAHPYDEDGDGLLDEDPPDDEDDDNYIEDLYLDNGSGLEFIRWEGIDDDGDGLLNEDWVGGVDLNRNYEWNTFYAQGSSNPEDETYRGPIPFSEPETRGIRDLAFQHHFKYAVSFHSGTFQVIGRRGRNMAEDKAFRDVTLNLSALTGVPYDYSVPGGYQTGMWQDFMYGSGSTIALTCEIYGNDSALQTEPGSEPNMLWERGVFQFFNPGPSQIESVVQRWLPVFTYTASRAISEAYDIAATSITYSKNVVGQGYTMGINTTITNQGEFTEDLNVTLYANETYIGSQTVNLTSRNYTTVSLVWNTTSVPKGNYTITAYAWPVLGETDTIDNTCTGGWVIIATICDITGPQGWPDGKVDMRDVSVAAKAFGSSPGDGRWSANCDIDNDGKVDMKDIGTIAKKFGTTP